MKSIFRARLTSLVLAVALAIGSAISSRADDKLVPLDLKLPAPAFVGTPKDTIVGPNIEPLSDKPRPPLMVPGDVKNLAPGSAVTTSDTNATPKQLDKLTDGVKESSDTTTILLRKGPQWVQFDLGAPKEIFAIVFWHSHDAPKVYHDVAVRLSDDPEFKDNVNTIFNNDIDNSSKLGAGADREYFETHEGKLIDAKGAKARYVRLYSKGSTDSALNEYTEVEIYGRPPK
jgi:hypothetical protein